VGLTVVIDTKTERQTDKIHWMWHLRQYPASSIACSAG